MDYNLLFLIITCVLLVGFGAYIYLYESNILFTQPAPVIEAPAPPAVEVPVVMPPPIVEAQPEVQPEVPTETPPAVPPPTVTPPATQMEQFTAYDPDTMKFF